MKKNIQTRAALALIPAAMLAFTSCSSAPKGETATAAAFQPGVPGGIAVSTYKQTATVTGIDAAQRKVTLVSPEGKKTVYTAGPDVVNFGQIRVGDQVKVTVAAQVVVFMRKNGEPANDAQASAVALAPVGAKPGVLLANTEEITAKIKALDLKHHKATLEFPGGNSETVEVRKDVDLTKVNVGDEVVIRTTEALAILVEKP